MLCLVCLDSPVSSPVLTENCAMFIYTSNWDSDRFHHNCLGRHILTMSNRTTLIVWGWQISRVTSAARMEVRCCCCCCCCSRITLATEARGCSWTTTRARTGFSCRMMKMFLTGCLVTFWVMNLWSFCRGWIEDVGFLFIAVAILQFGTRFILAVALQTKGRIGDFSPSQYLTSTQCTTYCPITQRPNAIS